MPRAKKINFKEILNTKDYNLLIEAYGKDFSKVEKYLNSSGWCRLDSKEFPHIDKDFGNLKNWWWRPKSLRGFKGCA